MLLRDADLASRQAAVPPATRAAEFAPPPAGKRIAEPGDGRRPTDTVAPRAGTLVDAVRTHDLKAGLATLLLGLRSWLESTSHAAAGAPRAAGTAQPDDALPPLYTARGLAESQPPVLPMAEPGVRPSRHPDPRPPGARADADAVEQLVRYVEGALARTRVHQFGAVHETRGGTDSTGVPTWIVELPLAHGRDADLLQLRIENHGTPGSPAAEAARVWQVLMCIDCAATGPLHALVRLAGLRLSATLWAERAGTLRAARAALGELDEALRAQGVEVERLECMPGKPAAAVGARFERLLDVRT